MTFFDDLSPYAYLPATVPGNVEALNVGWLDEGKPYAKGSVPDGFLGELSLLARDATQARTRGWHACPMRHVGEAVAYPVTYGISGSELCLGGAEIRVVSKTGEWLIAPDLVLHYVAAHSYSPPNDFVDAVLERRIAPALP
ncbi:hypothetical protein AB0H94_35995 [Streptomyces purpurascens]|uniref:DUF7919 family protein n=1 Tax=Streptomyces purpurascens TaxID=1924 RepID=UPI0034022341